MRSESESCQQQCAKLQKQLYFLHEEADSAFKAFESSNKALVCELEEKLCREKQDCQELRKQLMVSAANPTDEVLTSDFLRSNLEQILHLLETVGY